jgi:hypothetical protein
MRRNRIVKFRNARIFACSYSKKLHSQEKFKVKSDAMNFQPNFEVTTHPTENIIVNFFYWSK